VQLRVRLKKAGNKLRRKAGYPAFLFLDREAMVQDKVIPGQQSGGFNDTVSSLTLNSEGEALAHFEIVKARFLDVNSWGSISNSLAEFCLTDSKGRQKNGEPEEGDYIRINLPAPGTDSANSYEWVQVEYMIHKKSMLSDYESLTMLVRPAQEPLTGSKGTAHFFTEDATSTLMVRRDKHRIYAEVHGRNERPNTEVSSVLAVVRNVIMSLGAILGFSKLQWKALVNGLIRR
jgi:hypothetical protein